MTTTRPTTKATTEVVAGRTAAPLYSLAAAAKALVEEGTEASLKTTAVTAAGTEARPEAVDAGAPHSSPAVAPMTTPGALLADSATAVVGKTTTSCRPAGSPHRHHHQLNDLRRHAAANTANTTASQQSDPRMLKSARSQLIPVLLRLLG